MLLTVPELKQIVMKKKLVEWIMLIIRVIHILLNRNLFRFIFLLISNMLNIFQINGRAKS